MKITKLPQSCFIIETNNKKIVIDIGSIELNQKVLDCAKDADYIFITHRHADHINEDAINKIKKENTLIFSSNEVQKYFPRIKFNILKNGDEKEFDFGKLSVVNAIHGYLPIMKQNNAIIKENIGFIFEIENKKIYHTSDTICFENNNKCDIILVPVCGHGVVMSPFEAAHFSKETNAKITIPCHYDNPTYPIEKEQIKKIFDSQNLNYKILNNFESIEI